VVMETRGGPPLTHEHQVSSQPSQSNLVFANLAAHESEGLDSSNDIRVIAALDQIGAHEISMSSRCSGRPIKIPLDDVVVHLGHWRKLLARCDARLVTQYAGGLRP
jgi:hypothetical protein